MDGKTGNTCSTNVDDTTRIASNSLMYQFKGSSLTLEAAPKLDG